MVFIVAALVVVITEDLFQEEKTKGDEDEDEEEEEEEEMEIKMNERIMDEMEWREMQSWKGLDCLWLTRSG